jgi:hypothetical protein
VAPAHRTEDERRTVVDVARLSVGRTLLAGAWAQLEAMGVGGVRF